MTAGRVWKFGDNINTDLMLPGSLAYASEEIQKKAVFSANRPGWVDLVQAGDILLCGQNFGIGSSRPAARSLRNLGLGCVMADSINGLFFRNAVNYGFLAVECPGVSALFEEGQTAEVSLDDWVIRNRDTGSQLQATPVPEVLLSIVFRGGVFPLLEEQGFVSKLSLGELRKQRAQDSAPSGLNRPATAG
jgi:3-isopropylmalate/(R)-2-methylmalate dehydratase small subunit